MTVVIPPTNANRVITRLFTGSNWLPCTAPASPPNSAPAHPATKPEMRRSRPWRTDLQADRGRRQLAVSHRGELPPEPAAAHDAHEHREHRRTRPRTTPRTPRPTPVDKPRISGPAHGQAAEPEHPRVAEDASRPISASPKVLSARCRPRSRTAGRATSTPRTAATTPPRSIPATLSPPNSRAGDPGTDADEEVLGERHLTGQPGEGDERQGDAWR